jgi:hypothetical protein
VEWELVAVGDDAAQDGGVVGFGEDAAQVGQPGAGVVGALVAAAGGPGRFGLPGADIAALPDVVEDTRG